MREQKAGAEAEELGLCQALWLKIQALQSATSPLQDFTSKYVRGPGGVNYRQKQARLQTSDPGTLGFLHFSNLGPSTSPGLGSRDITKYCNNKHLLFRVLRC